MAAVVTVSIPGTQGVPGPPNKLTIGTVTTGAPGTNASATITGIAPNQVLSLTIPRGADGNVGVTAADITDATTVGRNVLTATDAAAARTAIGAGTSSLAIGATSTTAKAGDYTPPIDQVAGTASMRTLGTGATQAAAGNHTHADLTAATNLDTPDTIVKRSATGTAGFSRVSSWTGPPITNEELTRKDYVDGQVAGRIPSFADPNADRIVFWDDSVSAYAALTASTGLTISGTNMTVRTANETQTGIVELATAAETTTGTDNTRAVHPQGLKVELDKKVTNGGGVTSIQVMTQAAYDALGTKNATTLYVIQG